MMCEGKWQGDNEQMRGVCVTAQMFGWRGVRRGLAAPSKDVNSEVQVFS